MSETPTGDATNLDNSAEFRQSLIRSLLLPLLLLPLLIGIFLWQFQSLLATSQLVDRTNQVIAQLHITQELLVDQETGVRGYVITGEEEFLEPYNRGRAQLPNAIVRLNQLVFDNPEQQQKLNGLINRSEEWQAFAHDVLTTKRANGDTTALVLTRRGKLLMDDMRARLAEMIASETRMRDIRSRSAQSSSGQIVIGSVVGTLLLGMIIAWFIVRELRRLSHQYTLLLAQSAERAAVLVSEIEVRRAAERRLLEKASELEGVANSLEARNRELDQFAYITSHDLKAPLRGIANLSQWIEEDLGDAVTDEVRQHLNMLRGRVNRMESFIEGILLYSRVGRVLGTVEQVNVAALLDDIIEYIAPPPGFTITVVPPMPTIPAERLRLEQVFSNLLTNAIKHHDRQDGAITISVEPHGAFYRFAVADDGPGIAPEYQERIFVIFQTLASRDRVESSGLGLALIRKIVEQHNGHVWVESREGHGATFSFTWPQHRFGLLHTATTRGP